MALTSIKIKNFSPMHNHVWVTDLDHGQKITQGGLIIPDDDMTNRGIRPRWGQVWAIGPKVNGDDIKVGDWVMTEHGRWTNKITLDLETGSVDVWRLDYPNAVLIKTDKDPRKVTGDLSKPALEFALKGSGW